MEPSSPGVWLYEKEGNGKLFVPAANFSANKNSGRGGALAWDACGARSATFDNGHPLKLAVGAVSASGTGTRLIASFACGRSYNYPNMSVSPPFGTADGIRYSSWLYFEMEKSQPQIATTTTSSAAAATIASKMG
jgi:hypothetical protein